MPLLPDIKLTDTPGDPEIQTLARLIRQFNETAGNRPTEHHPIAILVSDPETGEILGGLFGWTSYAILHIDLFYLPEAMRGSGLGSRMLQQAEEEAIRRGCHTSWLDTFSFQAPDFYQRRGYAVFGEIEGYAPDHSRYFLKKALATRTAEPLPAESELPTTKDTA
jgi:GNAT superfamily N-acetyltransferase